MIDEVNYLINELDISTEHAEEKGDDYVMLTNYQTLQNMDEIGDFLPNHSF